MKEGHALRDSNLDLRVVRTKTAIRNALVELIEEKGFDAITVKILQRKQTLIAVLSMRTIKINLI